MILWENLGNFYQDAFNGERQDVIGSCKKRIDIDKER